MRHLLLILAAVSLLSCGGGRTSPAQGEGDTVSFKYATQISVVRHDGYTVVKIRNPWKEGVTLHRYVLVPTGREMPTDLPEGTVIRTPVGRAVMFTTVHCAMLTEFGRQECITGVADLKYIKLPWIQRQVAEGRIADVGNGMSPVIEKIIDQRPDVLLLSPFENSGGYGKLEEIDIPIVECAEYMEPTPLARAEWIRFYGMLFGCEEKADSMFHETDSCYNALKQIASVGATRSVLLDKITGGVWYVPGGRSTLGQMIRDAGAEYPWASDEHSGSISLPFEAVLEKAGETDTWIFRYGGDHEISIGELSGEHHGYGQFKAFRTKEIYGCNVEQSLFYEETPFHPDWLLNDFIRIVHPEIQGLNTIRYFKKV